VFLTSFPQFIYYDLSSAANGKDDEDKKINCQRQENIKNPFCMNVSTLDMFDQICTLFSMFKGIF
jgi:hypothetical protein